MRGNLLSDTIIFKAATGSEQKALGEHLNLDCRLKISQQIIPFSLSNSKQVKSDKFLPSLSRVPGGVRYAPPSGLVI